MNYLLVFLCLAWIFFAFTDKERALLFALLALSNAIQLCQNFMPVWLFGVSMVLIGGGIYGAACYYNARKVGDTFDNVIYALIGVMACAMGIVAF